MTEAIALTLLHFVWQGALLGILARAAFRWLPTAEARYTAGCAVLLAMALFPAATLMLLWPGVEISHQMAPPVVDMVAPAGIAPPGTDWLRMVCYAWCAGVVFFSLRMAGGFGLVAWRMRTQSNAAPREWQQRAGEFCARLGIERQVRIVVSPCVTVASVFGAIRPVVMLPASALTGLPAEHISAVLAHELVHIARRDFLVNCVQCAIEAVMFYHPAVWWVSARIREERELCCDSAASELCGDRITYARALLALEEARQTMMPAANGGSLQRRIEHLFRRDVANGSGFALLPVWMLAVVLATALWAIAAEQTSAPPARPPVPPKPVAAPEKPAAPVRTAEPASAKQEKALREARRRLEEREAAAHLRSELAALQARLAEAAATMGKVTETRDLSRLAEAERNLAEVQQELAELDQRNSIGQTERMRMAEMAIRRAELEKLLRGVQGSAFEHERRVRFAEERFGGAETPRGRVYVLNGPPAEIESHSSGPHEIWRYSGGQEFEFRGPGYDLVRFRFGGKDYEPKR